MILNANPVDCGARGRDPPFVCRVVLAGRRGGQRDVGDAEIYLEEVQRAGACCIASSLSKATCCGRARVLWEGSSRRGLGGRALSDGGLVVVVGWLLCGKVSKPPSRVSHVWCVHYHCSNSPTKQHKAKAMSIEWVSIDRLGGGLELQFAVVQKQM